MWKVEEDFPRGGRRHKVQEVPQDSDDGSDEEEQDDDDAIKTSTNTEGKPSKKRKQQDLEESDSKRRKEDRRPMLISAPLYNDLRVDVCVLACVSKASDYSVSVSLPGNLPARLPITQLSPAYTDLLQNLAQADDPSTVEEVPPIESLLKPGMLIPVKITEVSEHPQSKKKIIKVSGTPSDVNQGLPIKALNAGQLLYGSVSSVEDHGYRVDLGLKGLQAFLVSKDAKALVEKLGCALQVGQPLWCVPKLSEAGGVREGESRVINVTADPALMKTVQVAETTNLDSVRPGMTMPGVVQSVSPNGVSVIVYTFQGSIHSTQLAMTTSQYKPGDEIKVKVLYVNQTTKELQLTNLPRHLKFEGFAVNLFGDLKVGSFADAKVARMVKGKGILLNLPEKRKAFAAVSHLSDDEKERQNLSKFPKGNQYRCRVLGFNHMEGLVLVSLKQSVLEQQFLNLSDISVGEVLEVFVKDVTPNGIMVKISKGIYSFISCMHLTDVPIKHPEKKFERGKKLKARVLKVDLTKSKVMLTLKKSLVRQKGPILTEYSQLKPYMELEGYIIAVKDTAVVVAFYNGVQGYVTLKDMSTEKVDDPSSLFYKGQVIKCRVVHFVVEERKLKLSFNFGDVQKKEKAEKPPEVAMEPGQTFKVHVYKEELNGLRVRLVNGVGTGFLPYLHLSDFPEVRDIRQKAFRVGQKIGEVTVYSVKSNNLVTLKESLVQSVQVQNFVKTFDDLEVGCLYPAVVKNHQDYGMFLEVVGGFFGLCPLKTMTNIQPLDLQTVFPIGQSVTVRITRLDSEKKRFLGSVRLDETYEGGLEPSLSLVHDFLLAREEAETLLYAAKGELSIYADLSVGSKVTVKVTSVLKKGFLGELPSGASALVTKYHFGGIDPEEGCKYEAIVLTVDPLTPCVELTIDPRILKAVSTLKDNPKTQLKPGQVVKVDVLLVKPEFMLMCARGHAAGRFIYVPTRQHINDVTESKPYKPGTFTEVVIKDLRSGFQLAVLRSLDPENSRKKRGKDTMLREHNHKPGTVVEARIRTVHPLQLNLDIVGAHGRVHVTEMEGTFQEGDKPFSDFKQKQKIKVAIIGLRDVASERYLTPSHPKAKNALIECSLRESKLANPTDNESLLVPKLDLKFGDTVTGYVISAKSNIVWLQLSLSQQGCVDQFHLTTDVEDIDSLKFVPGEVRVATVIGTTDTEDKLKLSFVGKQHEVSTGKEVPALVTSQSGVSTYVRLPGGSVGVVTSLPNVHHERGQLILVKVEKEAEDKEPCQLSLISSSAKLPKKQRKRAAANNPEEDKSKLQKLESSRKKKELKDEKRKRRASENEDSDDQDDSDAEEQLKPKFTVAEKGVPRLSVSGFSWGDDLEIETENEARKDDDDDDDEEEAAVDSKTKKKRKRDEEKLIQEYERNQLSGSATPETAQEFERLVVASPHSSLVWLRYMAHHVELGEMEKARAVAERALSTISFREEQEKKNIWLAYLNMEATYGESIDVKKLLERAVQYNDPLDINLKMCEIYTANNKVEDAEQLYMVMTRKHKKEKAVWKAYGHFLFKAGRLKAARNLLQRCTESLDKKDHVEVITKFASLEFSLGDAERGRTMLENLLASYPSRTDLWSVYTDLLTKSGDLAGAREILSRAVKQKFAAKKLTFLLQKMIKFEQSHGTEDQVQQAKDLALKLLET